MSRGHNNPAGPAAVGSAVVGKLLASEPATAEVQARDILKAQPQNADALLVLGSALRRQGDAVAAKAILEPIVASQPDSAFAQLELGRTLGMLGQRWLALESLAKAVDLSPTFVDAWCALGDEIAAAADAGVPSETSAGGGDSNSSLDEAENALRAGHPEIAEALLCAMLEQRPTDVQILKLLAEAAFRTKKIAEAEEVLARCVALAPNFQAARFRYAIVLLAQEKGHRAITAIDELMRRDPSNAFYRELKASALYETGEFHQAIAQYEELLNDGRRRPGAWMSYGRALRAIGRVEESVEAFRKAVEILPAFAAGYRTLATVKTVPLGPATIDVLGGLLARPGQLVSRRAQLHFALGRVLEDAGRYAESFDSYRLSNELQATGVSGTVDRFLDLVRRTKSLLAPAFLRERAGNGCAIEGPIFIVGMLRAGSTLVQEILAAHSAIERTGELRDLNKMTLRLRADHAGSLNANRYPEVLGLLDTGRFGSLGEEYMERTRPRRKSGLPFFIDKLPENFINAGLIHLILPNAKIIDVRRNPLDCCLSCFTNYFPEGPAWSHSLDDLGRYYAGYVELMAHFDEVLPGRIHRVIYEQLVEEPENEVRRLLDYLGLPFEQECLRFYEREQAIVTTSIEQARRQIYQSAVGNSTKFEPWLGPLKSALGPVLNAYPGVPKFYPALRASFNLRLA